MIKIIIDIFIIFSNLIFPSNKITNNTYVGKEINIFKNDYEIKQDTKEITVLATYHGNITAYGPDCNGCSGITSSGYNVRKGNIYYNDKEYGKVRIVAADKSLPFGSIIKISNLNNSNDITAIVLDRGSAIGFKKKVFFDLLYKSEEDTLKFGKQTATFELLRRGY